MMFFKLTQISCNYKTLTKVRPSLLWLTSFTDVKKYFDVALVFN